MRGSAGRKSGRVREAAEVDGANTERLAAQESLHEEEYETPLPETDREFAYLFLAMVRIPTRIGEEEGDEDGEEAEESLYINAMGELQIFEEAMKLRWKTSAWLRTKWTWMTLQNHLPRRKTFRALGQHHLSQRRWCVVISNPAACSA